MKVEFFIDLKEGCGYRKPCEIHETSEITVSFNAKSLACAQRQLKALVKDGIIESCVISCSDKEYEDLEKSVTSLEVGNELLMAENNALELENKSLKMCIDELETELQQYKAFFSDKKAQLDRIESMISKMVM